MTCRRAPPAAVATVTSVSQVFSGPRSRSLVSPMSILHGRHQHVHAGRLGGDVDRCAQRTCCSVDLALKQLALVHVDQVPLVVGQDGARPASLTIDITPQVCSVSGCGASVRTFGESMAACVRTGRAVPAGLADLALQSA